jgi:hypothetical protein
MFDSERILVELGFTELSESERQALRIAQGESAIHRRNGRWDFWKRFGQVKEENPAWTRRHWNAFCRAFSTFYFFSALTIARRVIGLPSVEKISSDFAALQERLSTDYFGGVRPDTFDFQLFGIVQMVCSIPGPPLHVVREDPSLKRLRSWISRMQERFSNHPNLYSGPFFEPNLPTRESAPISEQLLYGCGTVLIWMSFPISLAIAIYFLRRVRKLGLA